MSEVAWAKAYARIVEGCTPVCPVCGKEMVQSRFIGNPITRLGFGILWCSGCGAAGRLSRLEVPKHLPMRAWDDEDAFEDVPPLLLE